MHKLVMAALVVLSLLHPAAALRAAATPAFLIGAAPDAEAGGNADAQWRTANSRYGPLTARRSYSTPGAGVPTDFAKTPAASDVGSRASLYSFHPAPRVDSTAAFRSLVASIPSGHTAFLTPDHEIDAMVRRGQLTAADYVRMIRSYAPIVRAARAHGHPHVYLVMNVTGFLFNKTNNAGPEPESLWPGDGVLDAVTVDAYGEDDWPVAAAPGQYGGVYAYAVKHDIPWGVYEIGAKEDPNDAGHKARWVRDHLDFAASHGSGGRPSAVVFSWYDSAGGGASPTPSSSAPVVAVAKDASSTYHRSYTDPGL
ncbi:hypothetical protein [Fodinicola acaciae]|uniref:hypothetical protein n=1 Tax=Fodinicola acaciae TaxID=2681555 RepID=UPI0013D0CFD7|nr:hypothetical protein [Fodinicola acaciae]